MAELLSPAEKLEVYLLSMKAAQRAKLEFRISGSALDDFVKVIEGLSPENGIYRKEIDSNGVS